MFRKGFTLVEILIVFSIIGIVIAISIPGFMRARRVSQTRACQANLRNIAGAQAQWAMANRAERGAQVTWEELLEPSEVLDDPYLNNRPQCPAGGEYLLHNIGMPPECTSELPGHNLRSAHLSVREWTVEQMNND